MAEWALTGVILPALRGERRRRPPTPSSSCRPDLTQCTTITGFQCPTSHWDVCLKTVTRSQARLGAAGGRQRATEAQWWPPSKVMIREVVALDDCTRPTPCAGLVKPR